ncbi:MAG: hypothetical protein NW237_11260 [Cyanobacteriota bacterium]|nr:hypothetical protein [Cyanobacteriota bacterium]
MMVCKLCQQKHDLRESHIISEAFYEGVYDKRHRAVPISMEYSELKFIRKGFREKLLCGGCEQKFSKRESALKRDLIDIGNQKSEFLTINHIGENLFKVEGIWYKEFKLAILSILWRMSVTSDPFFESYSLGIYEEKLRQKLFDEDVPGEKNYPIMVSRYELDKVFHPGMIIGFPPRKYDQIFTVQSFMIWGHRFMIFVNDKNFPKIPVGFFLRDSGELLIDVRSLVELASPKSVLSKIYDKEVESMYARMR